MADLSITASAVDDAPNAMHYEGTAGEALVAGQACYLAADGLIYKASNATASYLGMCVVSASAAGQPTTLVIDGYVTINAAATQGTIYIVSANAGGVCPMSDIDNGQYVSVVGAAISSTSLYLRRHETGITYGAMDYPDRVLTTANADLIAYWRLNEADPLPGGATGVADSSGKGYLAAFTGQYTSGGDGQAYTHPFNHAVLGLDGVDDYVELGLLVDPVNTEPYFTNGSMAVWLYFEPDTGGTNLLFWHKRGNFEQYVWQNGSGMAGMDGCGQSYSLGALTGWHCLGMCWDSTDVRWFLDGAKVNTGAGFTFVDGGYSAHVVGYQGGVFSSMGVGEIAYWRAKLSDSNMIKLTLGA